MECSLRAKLTAWDGADHTDHTTGESSPPVGSSAPLKRSKSDSEEEGDEDDEEPVRKRSRREDARNQSKKTTKQPILDPDKEPRKTKSTPPKAGKAKHDPKPSIKKRENSSEKAKVADTQKAKGPQKEAKHAPVKDVQQEEENAISDEVASEVEDEEAESDDEDKPEIAAKAREKIQSTLKNSGEDPYPDWKPGEPVPYAALCTTFSLIEMTTKRLVISAHCSLFLRQVLRLTPQDLLPTVQLMINKLAADYAGIELGIGESLIMKAIGETTGRSLQVIKADQNEIGDLGLVAAKSRSNQPTMFKPKPLTVRGVLEGLMGIATVSGDGSQGRKIAGIKKLLSAADTSLANKGSKGIDITKDKGGASEAKFIVRFLEGKLRLGLAEKTVLVGLAHAMVVHETEKKGNKRPSNEKLAEGEAILKTVYR